MTHSPRRLEEDRERRVLACDRQQVGGPLSLLPQRRSLIGTAPREQQRARRALAKARREHRGPRQLRDDQVVDVLRVDGEVIERQIVDRFGKPQHDAVVAPHELDVEAPTLRQPVLERHRPRRVDLRAERREHAHPPVADLVAEALDDDRAVVGHGARGLGLLVEVAHKVGRGALVEAAVTLERAHGILDAARPQLAHEGADRAAELQRPAGAIAVPERHLAGLAGRGRDDHALVGDVVDAPGRRAQQERLAGARLVDHLLVELADPRAVGQEDAEQAAVGDGAGVGHGQALRAGAPAHCAFEAVPHDARPQLTELL